MDQDVKQLKKRLTELAQRSYRQNMYTFTGFLSLSEQEALFEVMDGQREIGFSLSGDGTQSSVNDCERRVARFGSEEELGYEQDFPIECLQIRPLSEKFADDLSHRDILGAVMNLGIERDLTGDIYIDGKTAYLFCINTISGYICDNLEKIRHTSVCCSCIKSGMILPVREPSEETFTVASERADAMIAKIYQLSRGDSQELFRTGKVYLNGRLCENNSVLLKTDDRISVRGFGRFIYRGCVSETRKGKWNVKAGVYR